VKITGRAIEAFLERPGPEVAAALVSGPDEGLVKERADRLTRGVAGSLDDPFRVALLDGDKLAADPARLADEAMAQSLGGGRRAVRISGATDALAELLESFFEDAAGDSLVILEADDLGPRSALRKLFEGAKRGAALACYRDEGAGLESLVRDRLKQEGLAVTAEALDYLTAHLGSDRGITNSELEKLALYMAAPGAAKRVELADAEAIVGDSALLAQDDLVYAIGDGELGALDRAFARNLAEGAAPISLIRATARHFLRLQWAAARVRGGEPLEAAMKALRPPVFFRYEARFRRQLQRWTAVPLAEALKRLIETERRCKRTGMPAAAIARQAFIGIARLPAVRR
jgi:DNA polymerase-3 subunit delta